MSSNDEAYSKINSIIDRLNQELHSVAEKDENLSENESGFIKMVDDRIPQIKSDLKHCFEDDEVTEWEKIDLYEKLGDLMRDSVNFAKNDDRIDADEIQLITKLKQELNQIITNLRSAN